MIDITSHIKLFKEALVLNFKLLQQVEKLVGNECPTTEYLNSDSWDEVSESLFFALVSAPLNKKFGTYALYNTENKNKIVLQVIEKKSILIGTKETDKPNTSIWLELKSISDQTILDQEFRFIELCHPFHETNEEYLSYVKGLSSTGIEISIPLSDVLFITEN
jgi:hypothetical protein